MPKVKFYDKKKKKKIQKQDSVPLDESYYTYITSKYQCFWFPWKCSMSLKHLTAFFTTLTTQNYTGTVISFS